MPAQQQKTKVVIVGAGTWTHRLYSGHDEQGCREGRTDDKRYLWYLYRAMDAQEREIRGGRAGQEWYPARAGRCFYRCVLVPHELSNMLSGYRLTFRHQQGVL
jgi:hypothetical protein